MEDVSPKLYEAVKKSFENRVAENKTLQKYIKDLDGGKLKNFKGAYDYTELLGTCLADSFQEVLSSGVLPDGKMYYNIAKSVVEPFLTGNYEAAVDAAAKVEEVLNNRSGIGIKPVKPEVDQDKIDGIINRLSSEDNFDDVKWILDEPVVNLTQSGVDDTIEANVEFHAQSGFTPTVTRISTRKCCEWCSRLEGKHKYPNVPKDVYRRHENCRCYVEYDPGDGKKQNVWTKRTRSANAEIVVNMNYQPNTKLLTHINESGEVIDPMDGKKYEKIKAKLEAQGCPVIPAKGDDMRYLLAVGAEGISDEYGIMHLGETPAASTLFEEIIHHHQIEKYGPLGYNNNEEAVAREIAANRKLLKYGKSYGFTETDFKDVQKNLDYWERQFELMMGVNYDKADIKR